MWSLVWTGVKWSLQLDLSWLRFGLGFVVQKSGNQCLPAQTQSPPVFWWRRRAVVRWPDPSPCSSTPQRLCRCPACTSPPAYLYTHTHKHKNNNNNRHTNSNFFPQDLTILSVFRPYFSAPPVIKSLSTWLNTAFHIRGISSSITQLHI